MTGLAGILVDSETIKFDDGSSHSGALKISSSETHIKSFFSIKRADSRRFISND